MEKGNRERHFVNIDEKMGLLKRRFSIIKKKSGKIQTPIAVLLISSNNKLLLRLEGNAN